ncbi:MAG: hypothetical protein NTZ21_02225 [Actinobacteria bacterium]|nr:hypothetical protein [Actinomycetota bacterium]
MASSSGSGKRPFWMHQAVEYLLGGVLVAQGLQSPDPLVPTLAGVLVLANACTVRDGALSAFRVLSRATHRVLDVVVIAAVLVLAVQPWLAVDSGARIVMVGIAAVMAFVWWQSSFAEKAKREATRAAMAAEGGRSTDIGRRAGRLVGDGINAARRFERRKKT